MRPVSPIDVAAPGRGQAGVAGSPSQALLHRAGRQSPESLAAGGQCTR